MPKTKTIFISGCSSGIGYASAVALRERGFEVVCGARKSGDVQILQQQGFAAVQMDLASSASIAAAVSQLLELTGGKLDGLFNNAGFGQPGAVEDLSRATLAAQFETNVFGTHELTSLIIPIMRRQGHGTIIFNSSVLGFVAMPYRGAYNASKYALEGLVDTMRLELHGSGIKLVLIQPGPIISQFRKNAFAKFSANIDADASHFHTDYQDLSARLQKEGAAAPFTLPASAVAAKVVQAFCALRPKIHYRVTFPTYLFAVLKRLLPSVLLDFVLRKAQ